jgi:predicted secreted Zn-dependent protease
MNMSFAYYPGQEAQALAYYTKLLETQSDPKIRRELEALIATLQEILNRRKQDQQGDQQQSSGGLVQHIAA